MPKLPTNKAVTFDPILYRGLPAWANPHYLDGNVWRAIAKNQPIVMDIISTLSMYMHSLPWEIRAKNSKEQDKLQDEILYYSNILEKAEPGGFEGWLDFICEDLNMLPFGAATETVRYKDGRLYKLVACDGATFYPVNGIPDTIAVQIPPVVSGDSVGGIAFSNTELARIYRWPRPEIDRRGWGMTPLERVFLAIEMLSRGDKYYAKLLLDTPEAGILDLGDMSEDSATKWIESLKLMFVSNVDTLRVPVLYGHNTPAKFIPFGRPPSELLYDQTTLKYAQMVTSAWGLTLSDIGLTLPGSSLAGTIREQRKSKTTGYATQIKLIERHIKAFLPDNLVFKFIDTDDEWLVNIGRARSANAVAGLNFVKSGALTPKQWQRQLVSDGLITVPVDEDETQDIEEYAIVQELQGGGKQGMDTTDTVEGGKRRDIVRDKDNVPPSQGGMGEVKRSLNTPAGLQVALNKWFSTITENAIRPRIRKLLRLCLRVNLEFVKELGLQTDDEILEYRSRIERYIASADSDPIFRAGLDIQSKKLNSYFEGRDKWWEIAGFDNDDTENMALYFAMLLSMAANEIQSKLYELDIVSEPVRNYIAKPNTVLASEEFNDYLDNIIRNVNSGSEYYLRTLAFAVITDSEIVLEHLKRGYSLEEFLEKDELIDPLVDVFNNELQELFHGRIEKIITYENARAKELARNLQYGSVDEKYKKRTALGNEACTLCFENASLVWVGKDYLYPDKMGNKVKHAPFHPNCECTMEYEINVKGQPRYFGE